MVSRWTWLTSGQKPGCHSGDRVQIVDQVSGLAEGTESTMTASSGAEVFEVSAAVTDTAAVVVAVVVVEGTVVVDQEPNRSQVLT